MAKLAIAGGTPVRTEPWPDWPVWGEAEEQRLLEVLRSGAWGKIYGDMTEEFERTFGGYQGCLECVATTTGTSALQVALRAVDVEAGDEVIIPPYTFQATATAVLCVGATPVWADISADTYTLDPDAFEAAITPKTRAVIPVHVAGNPCMMDEISAIAEKNGIAVVEDAAQAHGAIYSGSPVGGIGDVGCFSFQASKNLSGGEGGAITTNDRLVAEKAWSLHNCGRARGGGWYEHPMLGSNERMTEFQAAVLLGQLSRAEEQNERRWSNWQALTRLLEDVEGISGVRLPTAECRSAAHLFLFHYEPRVCGISRAKFLEAVSAEGIPLSPGYSPLHRSEMFQRTNGRSPAERFIGRPLSFDEVDCPACERICSEEGFWLYQKHLLGPERDMEQVVEAMTKVLENRNELR
ncbi:MAG: aminotransferase class V-fold PLP-dependent enzyme [Armatimonadia bacterium]|nr:aminotransferase class V-fold PLP-dependent enzyme [Armatimonadia bacterium]